MAAAVAPDSILKQLADLWVTLAKPDAEGRTAVLRACTMTLITVADEDDDFSALGETLAALMPEHPARSIVVRLRATPGLSSRVYSQCWMPFGQRRQICCEQVEIVASDSEIPDVVSLLTPLLAADLPVVVWGRSARAVTLASFPDLAAIACKVIVDSGALPQVRAVLERLEVSGAANLLPSDLAWTRLTRWRETVARLFDNRDYQARLAKVSRIRVACPGTPSTSALYLGAWLANCLRDAGADATVVFEPTTADAHCGVASVTLSGAAPDDLEIALSARGDVLSSKIDGVSQCAMMARPTEYSLLREELGILCDDPVYRRALSTALQLAISSEVK
jgi:glucose-6-phosphate dehydrogenase assembly protein OpcA